MAFVKWIIAVSAGTSPSGKTRIWQIESKRSALLGDVRWYGPWRKYAFFPEANTIFEQDCLRDIADFIERETKAHREEFDR